ncbi:hypothetical protein [Streptomyces sp. NPDC059455]
MTTPSSVVVAGVSAAGLGTAEALRRKGYQGRPRPWEAPDALADPS